VVLSVLLLLVLLELVLEEVGADGTGSGTGQSAEETTTGGVGCPSGGTTAGKGSS
jgi:hypothetical protein